LFRIYEYSIHERRYYVKLKQKLLTVIKLLEKIFIGSDSTLTERMISSHPRITKRIQRPEKLIENEKNYN